MTAEHNRPLANEDEIDAALRILSEMQPPSEIVSRVHRILETAVMTQGATSSRRLLIPAAGLATAAFALVVVFTHIHRAPQGQNSTETAKQVATVPLEQATAVPPAAPVSAKTFGEGKRSMQPLAVRTVRRDHRGYRHAANLLSYPLTRQEKLLLQFAQHAKPADLQALNPEYQAKVEAQREAEFATYLKSADSPDTQESAN